MDRQRVAALGFFLASFSYVFFMVSVLGRISPGFGRPSITVILQAIALASLLLAGLGSWRLEPGGRFTLLGVGVIGLGVYGVTTTISLLAGGTTVATLFTTGIGVLLFRIGVVVAAASAWQGLRDDEFGVRGWITGVRVGLGVASLATIVQFAAFHGTYQAPIVLAFLAEILGEGTAALAFTIPRAVLRPAAAGVSPATPTRTA